jgi:hypothetical protein
MRDFTQPFPQAFQKHVESMAVREESGVMEWRVGRGVGARLSTGGGKIFFPVLWIAYDCGKNVEASCGSSEGGGDPQKRVESRARGVPDSPQEEERVTFQSHYNVYVRKKYPCHTLSCEFRMAMETSPCCHGIFHRCEKN